MRKLLLSLTAATALTAAAASIAPASAMTVGTASSMQAAIDEASAIDQVVYVCRHRYFTSRRVCWWRPGGYRGWRWRRRW